MRLLSTLTLLVSAVAANPMFHTARQDTSATKPFHLKTADASNEKHNDLYVYAYHTGAGFNDAVLTPDKDTASTAFLNGTYTQFDLKTPFPWGFKPIAVTIYAR